jgi:hypothetical protein
MTRLRALEPRVTVSLPWGKAPEKGEEHPRYIRHAKFGRGRVVEVVPGVEEKLIIDFGDGTQRTLLARFVEDEDAD